MTTTNPEFLPDTRTPADYGYIDDAVLDLTEWPVGAIADGRKYRLAWTTNERALMQGRDQSADEYQPDAEGNIQWLPIEQEEYRRELPDSFHKMIDGKTGTYRAMGELAVVLNKKQAGPGFLHQTFVFYPTPIEEMKAA